MLTKVTDQALLETVAEDKFLMVAELLFDHGAQLLEQEKAEKSIAWLTRCNELITTQDDVRYEDLRINATQNLTRAYILRGEESDLDSASDLLELAAESYPVAGWLYSLRLDYIARRYPDEIAPFSALLQSMIRIVQLTTHTFQSIIRKVHDLHKLSLNAACDALDLLLPRTADADETQWIEKSLITRIWVASQVSEAEHDQTVEKLDLTFSELHKRMSRRLCPRAIYAAQIVSPNGIY